MKELIIFAAGIVMGAWLMDEYHDEIYESMNISKGDNGEKSDTTHEQSAD